MEQKFEHSALEQEIKAFAAEIKERGLAEKGKEAVKTVIQEKMGAPSPAVPAAPPPAGQSPALPGYLQAEPPDVKLKVEKLLDLALHKGIKQAAEEARNTVPLVMDAFHDALVDKLYDELKVRGLLK